MASVRVKVALRRLIAGIALYGLILHTGLSTVHFYANLNPASFATLHGLAEICFGQGGAGERADDAPADRQSAGYSCPLCLRLAGLHLAPPPTPVALPVVISRPVELVGEAFEHFASSHFVRPRTRGPPLSIV